MSRRRNTLTLLRDTWTNFQRDGGPLLGGALAFFGLLSAAPLVMVAVAIAGAVFGEEAVRGELRWQIRSTFGRRIGDFLLNLLQGSYDPEAGFVAAMISIGIVLFAASRVFAMLRLGLNVIWGVKVKPQRRLKKAAATLARKRFFSFAMVLLCSALLLAVVAVKAGLTAIGAWIEGPNDISWVVRVVEVVVSFTLLAVLFTAMYKVLPDARISWRDVWIGGALTAFLMSIGSALIGLYLGYVGPSSTYGAAGSLVLLLLWVYYSGQIFFLGASFTEVWATRFGAGVIPESYAERVPFKRREEGTEEEENPPSWLEQRSPGE